jgi:hypothetical protein
VCWVAINCSAVPSVNDIAHRYILISEANIQKFMDNLLCLQ